MATPTTPTTSKLDDAYVKAAWAYFKKKCDPEAGEKMYKTFTGVKSVQVVKPLPPATDKDHFDQFRVGDAYSAAATSLRTDLSISNLVWGNGPNSSKSRGAGFGYAELVVPGADRIILKYYDPKGARDHTRQKVDRAISRVGISWEDISTREDRKYWVAGSRLRVVDIIDKSVIAERIGYFIESGFGCAP